jgi:hypothetical protein
MPASTPVTWTFEEIEGDEATTDTLLTASRADIGGVQTGAALSANRVASGIPGLDFLIIGNLEPGGAYPVQVEELAGDEDSDNVFLHIDKTAVGPNAADPGTEIAGLRYDLASGPVLVVPLG